MNTIKNFNLNKKRRVLITGGSGFWGSHLVERLKSSYDVYYTYFNNKIEYNNSNAIFMDLNRIETLGKIIDDIMPEIIIHTAAMTKVDDCEKNKIKAYRMNTKATEKLAIASSWMGFRLIFLSTDLVFYGEKGNYSEYDFPDSNIFYGKTKFLAEKSIISNTTNYIIFRIALTYGKGSLTNRSFTDELYEKLKGNKDVLLFNDQFRTPIYIEDGVDVIEKSLEMGIVGKIFHLAGPERISRYEFGKVFAKQFGFDSNLVKSICVADLKNLVQRGKDCSLNITEAKKFFSKKFNNVLEGIKKTKRIYKNS